MNRRITPAAAAYALLLLVVAVFNPVFGSPFFNFDDPGYVSHNPMVLSGITVASLRWAFTSFACANWHPLTWLSHMLDTDLFGRLPLGSHLMNVVYHAAASALLFLVLQRLTGAFWRSFLGAALFAVHPLRVESVAWVAERKDVLCACFWMLTLLAYLAFARRPGAARFSVLLVTFALGLMAKPMLVTLPIILLLLDWWPLGRFGGGSRLPKCRRLVLEKVPLLVCAALSAVVTFHAQNSGGAVVSLQALTVERRLVNAATAVVVYLGKIIWPAQLSLYYARPGGSAWIGGAAALLLAAISVAAILWRRRHPCLLSGWLWYLVALLPVLGIVQVGYQPWADRYTYLPSVGVTLAGLWFSKDAGGVFRRKPAAVCGAALVSVLACALATRSYLTAWEDAERLFRRALRSGGETYMMRLCLAGTLARTVRLDEAIVEFTRVTALNSAYPDGHFGMAVAFDMRGDRTKAAQHYRRALALDPGKPEPHVYYGSLLERSGALAEAEEQFREALRLQPGYTFAREGICRIQAGANQIFSVPLFPRCPLDLGVDLAWEILDKTVPDNYVGVRLE